MRDRDLSLNAAGCSEELQGDKSGEDEFSEVHGLGFSFPYMRWLLSVIAGIAVRHGNHGLCAAGERQQLEGEERSYNQSANVHTSKILFL